MNQRIGDPRTDIDCFARMLAELADPFSDTGAILHEAGVKDRALWDEIRRTWEGRLAKEPSLRERFSAAFASVRGGSGGEGPDRPSASFAPSASTLLNVPAGAPPPLAKPGAEDRRAIAGPPPEPLDVTGEVMPRVAPVLPFSESRVPVPAALAAGARAIVVRENTGTVELAHVDPRRPATPFEKSPAAPPPPKATEQDDDLERTTAYTPLAADDKVKGTS